MHAHIIRHLQVINGAAKTWGLECLRYEIKDIVPPPAIVKAMELQAEAERRKRAQVLESEGVRQATINESEAQRVRFIWQARWEQYHTFHIHLFAHLACSQ